MTGQTPTLPLLRGSITLEAALEEEENLVLDLSYPQKRLDFFVWIYSHRKEIEDTVSDHLGLGWAENCRVADVKEWIHGSFNVCVPVYVENWKKHPGKRVMMRFPLPYKIGESVCPGNADEKLRCEAATFIWIQEHCSDVPIPALWGFGFVGGQSFTRPENTSLGSRMIWYLKRSISRFLGFTLSCPYIVHNRRNLLDYGYLLMHFVDDPGVQMLSKTWDQHRHHEDKMDNLIRGLSRIILSLSKTPLPRIGSWTIDFKGTLLLSNRPLTLQLHQLENNGILTNMRRTSTYPTADAYYLDILSCHDNRIRQQPNSIIDEEDGRAQMANLTIMRALLSHFTDRELRQGPFFYSLTDMHQSNIFVDSNWNIKSLVDLEWACSLPAETLRAPYWLTGRSVDNLTGVHFEEFSKTYDRFLEIFEEEEQAFPPIDNIPSYRTGVMKRSWKLGSFWYFSALDTTKGLYNLFHDHIQPIFTPSGGTDTGFSQILSEYWAADTKEIIAQKLRDKHAYEDELRGLFEKSAETA